MRGFRNLNIAHVVTYVSSDGAFGGPVAVAVAQASELARRGHTVDLIAGWDGEVTLEIEGVNVLLFPVHRMLPGGFSGLVAPGLQRHMRVSGNGYDVTHVHLARDLITLPVARLVGRRSRKLVTQTHGMVMPDTRLRSRIFDAIAMQTTLLRASALLALTDHEATGLSTITGNKSRIVKITNGVGSPEEVVRPAVSIPQVVFLARLHPRKRVLAFAEAAGILIAAGSIATFHVIGPDEGDLDALMRFRASEKLGEAFVYEGAIKSGHAGHRLSQAAIYVLPSYGEVVPMTVLEAMAAGTPVVMTSDCGIAEELGRREAALVTDGSPSQLAAAITKILEDATIAKTMSANAKLALSEVFSIRAVVDKLEAIYRI
jgi:glycosyltransferase involved in cell wall biosynthesis